jgi:hypothetical protein
VPNDSKLLSLICSWILVHGDYVVVDKLQKKVGELDANDPAKTWMMAVFVFAKSQGMHKWAKWAKKFKHPRYLFGDELTLLAVKRKGEMNLFKDYGIVVPNGALRIRENDALEPAELAQQNKQYRNRLLFGASWRADIITLIQAGAKNPYQIAKVLGCSYEPAHRIFKEYALAQGIKKIAA